MGCKTNFLEDGSGDLGVCGQDKHCARSLPQSVSNTYGVPIEFKEYPVAPFRAISGFYVDGREDNAVMYPYIEVPYTSGKAASGSMGGATDGGASGSVANCGKVRNVSCGGSGFLAKDFVMDYFPDELSFDYQVGESWISYLYDTSRFGGVAGHPQYYIQICDRTNTTTTPGTPSSGTEGQPGYNPGTPGSSSSETTSETTCIPCTTAECSAVKTTLRYTAPEPLTNDSDCPLPELFAIGTDSNKIMFEYTAFSTQLPDGVTDFSVSYDGVNYEDAYDEAYQSGRIYISSQNPWVVGDEAFSDFEVYDNIFITETKTGFRVKFRIKPVFDDSGATTVFTGTHWEVMELLNPGTGYAIGDTFQLDYDVILADSTTTTLTLNLKVTGVGPFTTTNANTSDVLRTGDTLNGHSILRVFHTTLESDSDFPYHVAYLDKTGSNFAKDTDYTSSRNHTIKVKAGYGIADRAALIGRYEFTDKSYQYVTTSRDTNSPDVFNVVKMPQAIATLTNGVVTGFTIEDPGANLTRQYLGGDPVLIISPPGGGDFNEFNEFVQAGKSAQIEGNFSGGQLQSITILNGGSLYDEDDPPRVSIFNTFREETNIIDNPTYDRNSLPRATLHMDAYPVDVDNETRQNLLDSSDATPKKLDVSAGKENLEIKYDPERRRADELSQSLYKQSATDPLRPIIDRSSEYSFEYLKDNQNIDPKLRESILEMPGQQAEFDNFILDQATQFEIPEYNNVPEVLVETAQGRVKDLPYASEDTKYVIRQYAPDPTEKAKIGVELSVELTTIGECPTPGLTPPVPSSGSSTDSEGVTTAFSYSCRITGPFGPGCQNWSAKGEITFWNDHSAASRTSIDASEAFGNPLLEV